MQLKYVHFTERTVTHAESKKVAMLAKKYMKYNPYLWSIVRQWTKKCRVSGTLAFFSTEQVSTVYSIVENIKKATNV